MRIFSAASRSVALLRISGFSPLDMHLRTRAFYPWTQASSSGFRPFILSNCTGLVRIRAFHSRDSVFPCLPASVAVSRCNFRYPRNSSVAPFCRRRLRPPIWFEWPDKSENP
eukprot:jgi/Botrbrau1/14638/Bobra.0108s0001.1